MFKTVTYSLDFEVGVKLTVKPFIFTKGSFGLTFDFATIHGLND